MAARKKKPSATAIVLGTNAIRGCEAAADAALASALILRQVTGTDGQPADQAQADKLVGAAQRLQKAAARAHDYANAQFADRGIAHAAGPIIQGGGGQKD